MLTKQTQSITKHGTAERVELCSRSIRIRGVHSTAFFK